jgi:hypothetical protein
MIQRLRKPSESPVLIEVAMPDTMKDMRADRTNPNRTGAKRGDIVVSLIGCCTTASPQQDIAEDALMALYTCT